MKVLDCRNLACPGPVIQVKRALEDLGPGSVLKVKLDSESSRQNVGRFLKTRGTDPVVEEDGEGGWVITVTSTPSQEATTEAGKRRDGEMEGGPGGSKGNNADAEARGRGASESPRPPVVFIPSDLLGAGDDKLGRILMEGFVNTLVDQGELPGQLLLMNTGVRLAAEGSPVLEALGRLVSLGCDVLVCGTCLEFFDLKHKLAAGSVSNMYEMQQVLLSGASVIRL